LRTGRGAIRPDGRGPLTADRWRTLDGWPVEIVRLTCTPDRHNDAVACPVLRLLAVREPVKLARWFAITELGEALAPRAAVTYLA
jgi:hypothetical protein